MNTGLAGGAHTVRLAEARDLRRDDRSAMGLTFTYGEFGNRTGQNVTRGSAPVMNLIYNEQTTNRIILSGYLYDANGNLASMPGVRIAHIEEGHAYD